MVLDDYIHAYDFDFSYLNSFKEEFVDWYVNNLNQDAGYNVLYKHPALDKLLHTFVECIEKNFTISEKLNPSETWLYCQNNKHSFNCLHNHARTASVNGVVYVSPPDNDGKLIYINQNGEFRKLLVEENKLYLFPSWLIHMPEKQQSSDWRVCVNVEYLCAMRPVETQTNLMW